MEQLLMEIMKRMEKQDQFNKEMLSQMNTRFDQMEKEMNSRFDHVNQEFVSVKDSIKRLEDKVDNHATEFRSHFKHVEQKLDQRDKVIEVITDEITGLKYNNEYLSGKIGAHEMQINQIIKRLQS